LDNIQTKKQKSNKKLKIYFSFGICTISSLVQAYVYILFYVMIKEADMRLSSGVSMCLSDEKHVVDFIIRRNRPSGHRKADCAVGKPRLVNSAMVRGKPEKEL
jgi:hypothetical protein